MLQYCWVSFLRFKCDREFVSDIFVFAKKDGEFSIGAYESLCDGSPIEKRVVRFQKSSDETLQCAYIKTMREAFLRSAEFTGKYAIPMLDPDKKILCRRGERLNGRGRINARFVFRFHIPDEKSLLIAKMHPDARSSPIEEKHKNLFKMMTMKFANVRAPYRNLLVDVKYDFIRASESEVMELSEYAQRELLEFVRSQKR